MPLWFSNKTTQQKVLAEDEYEKAHHTFRKSLIQQYRTRLKSKLAFPMSINIGGKPTTFGTSEGYVNDYQLNKDLTIEHDDIQYEIGKILKSHGRLLLIGDAGSGKTTILLFAALDLLIEEDNYPLPLMLNLATWQDTFEFGEWYERNMTESYNLTRGFAKALIQKKDILPFFDGYDEINEAHRASLFDKMRRYYGSDKSNRFIISSRKLAYQGAQVDAPVYAQYEVKPLNIEQISKALTYNAERFGSENALLNAINKNPYLQEAVLNPFYLNTASFLYGKQGKVSFKAGDMKGMQKELVEIFLNNQVPNIKDKRYLGFLASNMNKRNMVVFELVDLKYDWLRMGRVQFFMAGFIIGLFIGPLRGLAFGIFLGKNYGLIGVLLLSLIGVLFRGFVVGLYGGFLKKTPLLEVRDKVKWSGHFNNTIKTSLMHGWAIAIDEHIESNNIGFLQINQPYQRFRTSMQVLHFSIVQHYHLLYLLSKKGLLPYKIVPFLNGMAAQHILESDGATWRFHHRILQDYFAKMDFDKDAPLSLPNIGI